MATRSTIALEYADGTVDQIYCHWDGYLENNGQILAQHYTDPFKVQKLMELGDMSSLNENIGEAHDFDDRRASDNQCTFYGRDRGETDTEANRFKDFEDYLRNHQYEEYEYILRQVDGKAVWFVCAYSKGYVELKEAIIAEAIERNKESA
jgi:hypothetical protein